MSSVNLSLGPVINGSDAKIEINGQDITNHVRSFTLSAGVNEVTTLEVVFLCTERTNYTGTALVVHECGVGE